MFRKKSNKATAFFNSPEFIITIIFLVLLTVVAIIQGNFFKLSTLQNTIISWTPLILLTMGQCIVIIGGGLDMSSGNAFSLMLCVLAAIMKQDNPSTGVLAIVICFLVMISVGFLNGLVVGFFKVPALIGTFATSYIYLGIALFVMPSPGGEAVNWIRGFYNFNVVDNAPAGLANFGNVVPTCVLLIIVALVIWSILRKTTFGRYLYATGSNRKIAYESGINTAQIQITAYLLNSLFIMLAALFMVGQNQSGSARIGDPLTLQSVASSIVGGVALSGGVGSVYFGIIGAMTMSLVSKLIFFSGINNDYQTLVSGIILMVAVASSSIIRLTKEKINTKGGMDK